MKPHPGIRKTVKWGGTVATVLLIALWALSYKFYFLVGGQPGWSITTWGDEIDIETWKGSGKGPTVIHLSRAATPISLSWRFYWRSDRDFFSLAAPLWILPIGPLIPAVTAWRLDTIARRRARPGYCPKCAYDRRGLPAATPCPECGAAPDPSAQATP